MRDQFDLFGCPWCATRAPDFEEVRFYLERPLVVASGRRTSSIARREQGSQGSSTDRGRKRERERVLGVYLP